MTKKFKKRVENFICENCHTKVVGDGYTDHCPNCLSGKHVDNHPGDRKSNCLGVMEPISARWEKGKWQIIYRCQKCGITKTNRTAVDDNKEIIAKISTNPVP